MTDHVHAWRVGDSFVADPRRLGRPRGLSFDMYAIIETGGHQYRVREGDRLTIDRRPEEPGTEITFGEVLLVAGGEGAAVIGTPKVEGASVFAEILREYRGKKIIIRKYRRRKGYRRKRGHRQYYTDVLITRIATA